MSGPSTWSPQQDAALLAVSRWYRDAIAGVGPQVFRLFGYAGTGKTTLAKEIAAVAGTPGVDVLFGAFTGKAAYVLRRKGCFDAGTIHSMIYAIDESSKDMEEPRFVLNAASDVGRARMVIIDEVSMVDEALGRDLLSFGTPVLVLGDPAQLPPVKGMGFFTAQQPDIMLTEVHRQAAESPIIRMATTVREGGALERGDFGDAKVIGREGVTKELVLEADQVLVGLNKTRTSYNARIREHLGRISTAPALGDKLICLRNDRIKKLLNGSMWQVAEVKRSTKKDREKGHTRLSVKADEEGSTLRNIDVKVRDEFWTGDEAHLSWEDKKGTDEFTYGYAITCHKSQGSQWENVLVFDEAASFREDAWRWRYTAITRAATKLTVVVNK